jgi:hypothetical protein
MNMTHMLSVSLHRYQIIASGQRLLFDENPFGDNPFGDNPFRDDPFGDVQCILNCNAWVVFSMISLILTF